MSVLVIGSDSITVVVAAQEGGACITCVSCFLPSLTCVIVFPSKEKKLTYGVVFLYVLTVCGAACRNPS